MYAEYFGLREPPFNITPDPRFLYLNDCYQEAPAALGYGIEARKGFISLIGDAGTGKTTLLRRLLDTVGPATKTVLLLNPTVSFDEILEHILLELGVPPEGGRKLVLLQRLNEFLLEHTQAGGNVALLIDEAQDLRPDVLEELRLLSNLETAREKILQIVLAGQPELDAILADPSLRQLRQRVALRIRLRPLSPPEVAAYVRARVERVGGTAAELFPPDALARLAMLSHGIPRLVNVLCDAALLGTFAAGKRAVTPAIVEDAWRDHDTGGPAPVMPYRPATPPPVSAATVVRPASVQRPGARGDGGGAGAAAAARRDGGARPRRCGRLGGQTCCAAGSGGRPALGRRGGGAGRGVPGRLRGARRGSPRRAVLRRRGRERGARPRRHRRELPGDPAHLEPGPLLHAEPRGEGGRPARRGARALLHQLSQRRGRERRGPGPGGVGARAARRAPAHRRAQLPARSDELRRRPTRAGCRRGAPATVAHARALRPPARSTFALHTQTW